jgi:hypothetical protein
MFWEKSAAKAFFFIGGFGTAAWAPLVPLLKMRLSVNDDVLGMLLLCIGIGSIITMPFVGAAVAKTGCQHLLGAAAFLFAAFLLLLCQVDSIYLAGLALLIFGALMGSIDVSVNIAAASLEQKLGRKIMSGMHAMWSIGGFVGAGAFGVFMHLGFTPWLATCIAAAIIALLAAVFSRTRFYEPPLKECGKSDSFALPRGIVIFIGSVALISFLIEGAVMDWSGVFLISERNMAIANAGTGFAVFSAAMLLMRLGGDYIVRQFGEKQVACIGAVLAFLGFVMLLGSEAAAVIFSGFFLIGIGLSNIVPIAFSLSGRQKIMPINTAVSAISTLGYIGVLAGPAAIGFVAQQAALTTALAMLAGLLIVLFILELYIYKKLA